MASNYIGLKFPFKKSESAFPAQSTDDQVVGDSIIQIIGTSRLERVMRPGLGTGAIRHVFSNNDAVLEDALKLDLMNAIAQYEPRAIIRNITFQRNPDGNEITATVYYVVKLTGKAASVSQKMGG